MKWNCLSIILYFSFVRGCAVCSAEIERLDKYS